jgi:small subunit ribosomal protein S6
MEVSNGKENTLRGYETCLVTHPEMSDSELDDLLKKLSDSISNLNGIVLKTEKQGKKKLQFPIKKQHKGGYCFLSYMGNQQILNELDHALRFNENVLRFQTIKIENISSLAAEQSASETKDREQDTAATE